MIHFRKLLFYLFLLVALSMASATAVLKLSDKPLLTDSSDRGVQPFAYEAGEPTENVIDNMVDETNRAIDANIRVSVVSKPNDKFATADADDSFTEELAVNVDDPILVEDEVEFADEDSMEPAVLNRDDSVSGVSTGLFIESAPDILTSASDSMIGSISLDDSREKTATIIESGKDELAFDVNDVPDASAALETDDFDVLFDEEGNGLEIDLNGTENAELDEGGFFDVDAESTAVAEEEEIVFDENAPEEEDLDENDFFDVDAEETAEEEEKTIALDENAIEGEDRDENDFFDVDAEAMAEAEEEAIVFDENEPEDEDLDEYDYFDDEEDESDVSIDKTSAFELDGLVKDESTENDHKVLEDEKNDSTETGEESESALESNRSADELSGIEKLEKEAELFDAVRQNETKTEEFPNDSNVETDANMSLKAVKADDLGSYSDEVVYDSDATESTEKNKLELKPNETQIRVEGASDASANATTSGQERNPEKPCVPPCAPACFNSAVLMLDPAAQGSTTCDVAVKETSIEREDNEGNRYHRASVALKTTSEMVPDDGKDAPVADELWIVSQGVSGYSCWSFENGSWIQKESESFFSGDDPRRVTLFWAHGYQTNMSSAAQGGFILKSVLDRSRSATGHDRKYRIVVWKWDSERDYARIRVDAKEKKNYAFYCGAELGKFMGRLNPKDDVVLIGFSFGAVVAGSALQALATTPNPYMKGHTAPAIARSGETSTSSSTEMTGRISLILISAACDLGSFSPGGCFSAGASLPTRVLNLYNPNDYALKFYPMISATSQAMGIAPLWGQEFTNAVGATFNINTNSVLGKEHSFNDAFPLIPSTTLADAVF